MLSGFITPLVLPLLRLDFGAGSAGVGVAKRLLSFFTINGLSLEEARKYIYTIDSKSLIVADGTGLQEHKCRQHLLLVCPCHLNIYTVFARTDYDGAPLTNLIDIMSSQPHSLGSAP